MTVRGDGCVTVRGGGLLKVKAINNNKSCNNLKLSVIFALLFVFLDIATRNTNDPCINA